MRPTPPLLYNKVLWSNMPQSNQEHLGEPLFFKKCTGFFFVRYTTHRTNGFTCHPKDEAMVKCLAQGHRCYDLVLNPLLIRV